MAGAAGREERMLTEDGVELWVRVDGADAAKETVIVPNAVYLERDFAWLARERRVVFYDLRGRGRSAAVSDASRLGIERDVSDLEAVRRHLGIERASLLGHSYLGLVVVLYTLGRPERVKGLIQIGAVAPPRAGIEPALQAEDAALLESVRERLQQVGVSGLSERDPKAYCEAWWSIFSELMVTRAGLAARVAPGICAYDNEHPGPMIAQVTAVQSSLSRVELDLESLSSLSCPVLTIHGRRDRNVPFAAAEWWTQHLKRARLVAVDDAAHAPWLEAPEQVERAIEDFLAMPADP